MLLSTCSEAFAADEFSREIVHQKNIFYGIIKRLARLPSQMIDLYLSFNYWVFQTVDSRASHKNVRIHGSTALFSTIGALRAPVFYRLWRQNPSHPLCGWSLTQSNFNLETGDL